MRTQSRELFLGTSLSGFMGKLDMAPIGGGRRGERTRVHNHMKRLFNAHIQLLYEDEQVSASVNSPLASRTEFWWNPKQPPEHALWESRIELGEKFFQEIVRHPVPLDMNILKALRRSPLGLDLYLWLTCRTFSLKRPLRLSWPRLYRQFGVDPAASISTPCSSARAMLTLTAAFPSLNGKSSSASNNRLACEEKACGAAAEQIRENTASRELPAELERQHRSLWQGAVCTLRAAIHLPGAGAQFSGSRGTDVALICGLPRPSGRRVRVAPLGAGRNRARFGRRKTRARTVPSPAASGTRPCPCRSCPPPASAALFLPRQGLAVSAICG